MEFKKYLKLLALTHISENDTVLDWCPFEGGDRLDTIITNYNIRCIQSYSECLPEAIEAIVEGIDTMEDFDLSTVRDLKSEDFDDIHIILIDLDAIGEIEERTTMLDHIKACLSKTHFTFLLQVSRASSKKSLVTYFLPLPVGPSKPEIMSDQETFERWLNGFCEHYRTPYTAPPPDMIMGDPKALRTYYKTLPGVAAKVRDAAIIRDLSEEETISLAHQVSMKEIALTRIAEQVHTRTNRDVVLDAIREPVVDMPIELDFQPPALRQVNLVELYVAQPMNELTIAQRDILSGLGIKEGFAAVFPDQPTVWDSVSSVKGVVKTTKFSAEMPAGLRCMGGNL